MAKAHLVVQSQTWNDQVHAEFTEVSEKVHVLFRTAKRHDMLGVLTAGKRASAAEALMICEQVFRMLLDQDYSRANRLLEMHRELLSTVTNIELPVTTKAFVEQMEQDNLALADGESV